MKKELTDRKRRSQRWGSRWRSIAHWEPESVRLRCGHTTPAVHAVAIYPNGRKLYNCPEGCGLQQARWPKRVSNQESRPK